MSKRFAASSSSSTIAKRRTPRQTRQAVIETLENRQLLSLVIDLRLPGGAKSAVVNTVGQKVNLEIWATVKGSDATGDNEGLQTVIGSLLSTNVNGGAANGTLAALAKSPFNSFGSQKGTSADLDGDGDLDVGSNDPDAGSDYFASRSGGVTDDGTVSGASKSFQIGTASFTVTSLKSGGTTNLNFRVRPGVTALWREDGVAALKNPTTSTMSVGAPVILTRTGTPTGNTIFGQVFNDTNKNGTHEAAEPGLSGATVYLDTNNNSSKDAGEKSATTDAGGNYFFGGLAAGSYHVREIAPAGFKLVGTSVFNTTFASANGGSFTANFVNQSTSTGGNTASISGILFNDGNKNGAFDTGDTLLAAKKMYIDANSNGKFDTGETSTLTNASGAYTFGSLAAGTYRVGRADTPAGYSFSTPAGGIAVVTLSAGQAATGRNFGVFQGTSGGGTGSISGTVWSDTDKDGVIDAAETKLSGKKMFIDADKDGVLDAGEKTAITNASGVFSFTGLAAGNYRIRRADTPAGYGFSTPASGFYDVVLAGGQNTSGKNFGAIPISGGGGTGSISGTVFSDTDKDGFLDASEAKLASKKIYIDKNKNGIFDTGDVSVLSNASGVYTFTGLAAGTYRIRRADIPSGFKLSVPSSGFYDITIAAGQSVTGKNIGAVPV